MRPTLKHQLLTLGLALLPISSCNGGGGSGATPDGELSIEATDKPFAHDLVTQALVRVSEISVHREAGASSGFLELFSGPPIELSLLDLQNGVTQILVRTDVPAGTYHQVRLVIESAYLELVNGNVYSTALGNLKLTSLATSGLKVFVDPPIEIVSGASETLLLDFDLTKTFHPIPANDPLAATSYKLHPVIHATNRSHTGEIRGVVRTDDGTGALVGVGQATVYVLPPGDPDPGNSVAATGTLSDGSYALIGIEPGTWDMLAVKDPLSGKVQGVEVSKGNATVVDLVIQ